MAPLLNVPVSHLGEMAFVTMTPDDMDVFLLCSTLCFPILLTNRRAVGTLSSKEMLRNEGTDPLYCQSWEDGSDWLNIASVGGATVECPRITPRRNGIRDRDSR